VEAAMPDRQRFVNRDETAEVLGACPNHDWRTIVGLARFGGLRSPSEVLSLRLEDIDWERDRLRVTSPKTAHHPGKGSRLIPLFPELRPILLEAAERAPEGAVYVVDERYRRSAQGKSGWRSCNLRTTFEKIIKRAGLEPWERLFHNMRASCETELCEKFPMHVVTAWMGHTPDIAMKHYCQVTEAHFQRATEAAQNAAQSAPVRDRKWLEPALAHNEESPELPGLPVAYVALRSPQTDGTGFEQTQEPAGNTGFAGEGGANSGAPGARQAPPEADLAGWLDACPVPLDATIRRGILDAIRAAGAPLPL
jgi:hypothetical protein